MAVPEASLGYPIKSRAQKVGSGHSVDATQIKVVPLLPFGHATLRTAGRTSLPQNEAKNPLELQEVHFGRINCLPSPFVRDRPLNRPDGQQRADDGFDI